MSAKDTTVAQARLRDHYDSVIRSDLKKEFGYANDFAVPKLEKIVINMGVGEATGDQKKLDAAVSELAVLQMTMSMPRISPTWS